MAGPQPGHGPGGPGGQVPWAEPSAPGPHQSKAIPAVWIAALVSVAGVALGISLKEDDASAWEAVHAWGALAILAAVLTAATAFGPQLGLSVQRAWQVSTVGAAVLVLYWVLFVLPSVGSNTSLLTTIGVAAGVIAAWIAPGRPVQPGPTGPGSPPRHTW